ncbi:MAG: class I SAM-dependent methyltransferase [Desulfoprunum sp.]|uniref:class I SAM-dependent methyltransferase n=1 Tax=Desulfoprunum sp. TaxID=2020866 RepID=UPI003C727186
MTDTISPSPSTFEETADIASASDDYATRFSGPVGDYFLQTQTRLTLDLLKDLPGASVLDVGGGHAQLTRPLIDNGYKVTVTGSADICRVRVDRSCEPLSFQYITCDSLNLPFRDREFDVVMAFRLLPHINQWQRFLQEMCRVAGKVVILDYADRRSANILYDLLFEIKKSMEGNTRDYILFTRKQLSDVLQANHFKTPLFKPEFFLPMVIHRKLNNPLVSRTVEAVFRAVGVTKIFGSPIILRSDRHR